MNQKNTKVVLITGAGKRLGEATALKLHSLGMDIIIHYNSSPYLESGSYFLTEHTFLFSYQFSQSNGLNAYLYMFHCFINAFTSLSQEI